MTLPPRLRRILGDGQIGPGDAGARHQNVYRAETMFAVRHRASDAGGIGSRRPP